MKVYFDHRDQVLYFPRPLLQLPEVFASSLLQLPETFARVTSLRGGWGWNGIPLLTTPLGLSKVGSE